MLVCSDYRRTRHIRIGFIILEKSLHLNTTQCGPANRVPGEKNQIQFFQGRFTYGMVCWFLVIMPWFAPVLNPTERGTEVGFLLLID